MSIYNKVVLNGTTLMDISSDTVDASHLLSGYTAHDNSGASITGTYTAPTFATQTKSATPTETAQTVTPDTGYDGLSAVNVGAIPNQYIIPSGTKSITANGTGIDVTQYSAVDVAVPTSSGMNKQAYFGQATRTGNSYGATTVTLTVAVTGTYKVSWTAWRSSSSGTMGTNLHVNNTTGTNQQTFTSTYGQRIELTGQRYNQGDVLTLYATSGSTSRSLVVANLIIEQTA